MSRSPRTVPHGTRVGPPAYHLNQTPPPPLHLTNSLSPSQPPHHSPHRQWPKPIHPPLALRECLQSLPKRRLNRPNQPANKPLSLASFQKQRRLPRHRQVRNASSRVRVYLSLRFHPVRLEMTRVL